MSTLSFLNYAVLFFFTTSSSHSYHSQPPSFVLPPASLFSFYPDSQLVMCLAEGQAGH